MAGATTHCRPSRARWASPSRTPRAPENPASGRPSHHGAKTANTNARAINVTIHSRSTNARTFEPGRVTWRGSGGVDRDEPAASRGVEAHHPRDRGEEGVVSASGHPG